MRLAPARNGLALLAGVGMLAGCGGLDGDGGGAGSLHQNSNHQTTVTLEAPSYACATDENGGFAVAVTAGATYGAPGGIRLALVTPAADGSIDWNSPDVCEVSFTSNGNNSWAMAPGETRVFSVEWYVAEHLAGNSHNGVSVTCTGAPTCGTEYAVEGWARNINTGGQNGIHYLRSPESYYTDGTSYACSVACAGYDCPMGRGYWDNHPEAWLPTGLDLGTEYYTAIEADDCLERDNSPGQYIQLAQQLIAAKLNVAAGYGDYSVDIHALISAADTMIASGGELPTGWRCDANSSNVHSTDASALQEQLEDWNTSCEADEEEDEEEVLR
ncbi:hypothetical protein [Vulgatibacter sp.]|uniref:hypothetical protein n=1 Tax=Vulgatibacter sp. TaxID=1971226 RepID=UPI003569DF76